MIKEIRAGVPVRAQFAVPGSKSITNRALICAALAAGESSIHNPSDSDDTALLSNALNLLGVLVRNTGGRAVVSGTGGSLSTPKFPIPVGNAGTTLRFLLSVASLAAGCVVIEGSPRMADRPNDDLLLALQNLGVRVRHTGGTAHFEVEGGSFRGGTVRVRAEKSSQFLSSLLMAAPYASEAVRIDVDGALASSSYVEITIDVMKQFGVEVQHEGLRSFSVKRGARYRSSTFTVEPDASGASYGFAAAALAGGETLVPGFRRRSLQGDARFVDVLERMGCRVKSDSTGGTVEGGGKLRGLEVDMNSMPDAVPTLAAVALFAEGTTKIRNVAHLRFKESNRLETLAEELRKTGAAITVLQDGLDITPAPLHGAELDPFDDHRLAMSFALVGLRVPGIRIRNAGCVRKSFPSFWDEFGKFQEPYNH